MDRYLCGVDLGGTKLAVGLVSRDGRVVDKIVAYDHTTKDEPEVVDQIGQCVEQLLSRNNIGRDDLLGVGVGFPGHLRYAEGTIIITSNLPRFTQRGFPIRQAIADRTKLRVLVDNDANAQGFAEFTFGAGVPFDSMIFITLSTGIGAGIILDGRIYRGVSGTAGEIGHTIVDPQGDIQCGCGNYGCLMTCASGQALPEIVKRKLDGGVATNLDLDRNHLAQVVDGQWIKQGLDAGDPLCVQVVAETADFVGIALANIFQLFCPPAVVLGGGLMNWGKPYLERIRQKFHVLARDMLHHDMKILPSVLKDEAGLVGAAALLLEE